MQPSLTSAAFCGGGRGETEWSFPENQPWQATATNAASLTSSRATWEAKPRLGASVWEFLDWVNRGGKTQPNVGSTILWAGVPD